MTGDAHGRPYTFDREPQLSQLLRALERPGVGGDVVAVSGETGAGKSTLVRRFLDRCEEGVDAWVGICDPCRQDVPLGPMYDVASRMGGDVGRLTAEQRWSSATFEELLRGFSTGSRRQVLVLEDLHWADEATLDFVGFIGRRIAGLPLLLVLTFSDDELDAFHPLHRALAQLPSDDLTSLSLPPLSRRTVAELARGSGQDADRVFALTDGNPLLTTELLAHGTTEVPPRIHALTCARLAKLDDSGRDVVRLVATCPDGLEPWLVGEVLAAPSTALDRCLASGLLAVREGRIVFRHELFRVAVRHVTGPVSIRQANRMLLRVLAASDGPARNDPERLVRHASEADDPGAVLKYARAAARRCAARQEHAKAVAHYEMALAFEDRLPVETGIHLREQLAWHAFLAGELDLAIETREWVATRAPRISANRIWLSRLYRLAGRRDDAERVAAEIVRVLEAKTPSAQLVHAYANRARLPYLDGRVTEGARWEEQATQLARQLDDPQLLAVIEADLGAALLTGGDHLVESRLTRALSALVPGPGAADALATLALHYATFRDRPRAESTIDRAMGLTTAHGMTGIARRLVAVRALTRLHHGDWTMAIADADAAPDRAQGHDPAGVLADCVLRRIRARRGEDTIGVISPGRDHELGDRMALAITAAEEHWWGRTADPPVDLLHGALVAARRVRHPWYAGELAWWLHRYGEAPPLAGWYAEPYRLMLSGDWRQAADVWAKLDCPFEEAEALSGSGDPSAVRHALRLYDELGASAAAARLRPHDPEAARERPQPHVEAATSGGLTIRQLDVLRHLIQGKSNADIAATLGISVRTVDHHVSAVLRRLSVNSRRHVQAAARQLGIGSTSAGEAEVRR